MRIIFDSDQSISPVILVLRQSAHLARLLELGAKTPPLHQGAANFGHDWILSRFPRYSHKFWLAGYRVPCGSLTRGILPVALSLGHGVRTPTTDGPPGVSGVSDVVSSRPRYVRKGTDASPRDDT